MPAKAPTSKTTKTTKAVKPTKKPCKACNKKDADSLTVDLGWKADIIEYIVIIFGALSCVFLAKLIFGF